MKSERAGLCVLGLPVLLAGCNFLTGLAFVLPPPKEKVQAEFDRLPNKNVLILAWAPQETLIEYPWVRLEIARYVGDKIAAHVETAHIVDARKVHDYLERLYDADFEPKEIGKEFKADIVIYLELLQYEMRNTNAPQLRRGTINASVVVYDLTAEEDAQRFELQEVYARVPEDSQVGVLNKSGREIRKMTYEKFAELVARKFYDHEVEL